MAPLKVHSGHLKHQLHYLNRLLGAPLMSFVCVAPLNVSRMYGTFKRMLEYLYMSGGGTVQHKLGAWQLAIVGSLIAYSLAAQRINWAVTEDSGTQVLLG